MAATRPLTRADGADSTPSYQYDLGVAFDAVPHSYGRSWFPCFDNFVERCTFEFHVRVNNDRTVFANGALNDVTDLGGGERIYHWSMAGTIPSYLASVAATNYVAVRDTFTSITGADIPVTLVAKPNDTTDMKNSFLHLRNAFDTFERWFGPYRWERVGYCLTTQGAMEHPTNISYPIGIVDGTLQFEDIMAHELAHHWFGDLVTCQRAEEMYINEGYAEYLSYLFLEDLYGRATYDRKVRENHHDMVSSAHLQDEGWYAVADVPQAFTYGEHSYRKGADLAHTLRGYLGDSLFSLGYTRVMANNAFSDMNSTELRDSLTAATGMDLTNYFDDWILQPGWAAFEVDSFTTAQDGDLWPTTVHVQQKLRHADHYYTGVPLSLTFESADGTRWTDPTPAAAGGEFSNLMSDPPFEPLFVFVNADERLALSSTVAEDTLTNTGTNNLPLADIALIVDELPAPAPVRMEEFWCAADESTIEPYAFVVSPDRWWRFTGQLTAGTQLDLRMNIDGRPTSSSNYDPGLVQSADGTVFSEDSLVVLYRPNPHFPWSVHADTDINTLGGDTGNGYARLTANNIGLGDYCAAWRKSPVGINDEGDVFDGWSVYPNPATDMATVEAPKAARRHGARVLVQDVEGRILLEFPVESGRNKIDLRSLAAQDVFLTARIPGAGLVSVGKLTIAH
jgi:Peptidase family M1 domain/Peptidase M1 N-terminal domain